MDDGGLIDGLSLGVISGPVGVGERKEELRSSSSSRVEGSGIEIPAPLGKEGTEFSSSDRRSVERDSPASLAMLGLEVRIGELRRENVRLSALRDRVRSVVAGFDEVQRIRQTCTQNSAGDVGLVGALLNGEKGGRQKERISGDFSQGVPEPNEQWMAEKASDVLAQVESERRRIEMWKVRQEYLNVKQEIDNLKKVLAEERAAHTNHRDDLLDTERSLQSELDSICSRNQERKDASDHFRQVCEQAAHDIETTRCEMERTRKQAERSADLLSIEVRHLTLEVVNLRRILEMEDLQSTENNSKRRSELDLVRERLVLLRKGANLR